MNLGNYNALWLLFAVPVILIPAYIWCFWQKSKALRILASSDMLKKINISVSLRKQIFKAFLLIVAYIFIVIALTEPKWNPRAQKIHRHGRNYPPSFKEPLHEGTEFNLLEKRSGWFHIKLFDGSEGWIPDDSAETI